MRLAVVTVNYCCAEEIVQRLPATAAQIESCEGEWWIVDNKSPDDSIQVLSDALASLRNAHLIAAERNGGFGYGNNRVVNMALSGEIEADYIYFLNPDASPEPGAIQAMLSFLDEHPEIGVLGSGLITEDGAHTDSMFRFPSFWTEIEQALEFGPVSRLLSNRRHSLGSLDGPAPVDWVAGTSFIARTDVLRKVGGFDEDFFLYWEEVELCHRIKKAGIPIYGLPAAKVRHKGGVSTGLHERERRLPSYWHQSRNLYFRKTGWASSLGLLNAATALCLAFRRGRQLVRRAPLNHPQLLKDHIRFSLDARRH